MYEPGEERRLRPRISRFEEATLRAGYGWVECDLTDEFARWMSGMDEEYREAYFESPQYLYGAPLDGFAEHVASVVEEALSRAEGGSVVAVYGIASLFGLARVSGLLERVRPGAQSRLLVFFPGEHEDGNYRLLDARDGWNYLATPITSQKGEHR